jgi:hypothetical protein
LLFHHTGGVSASLRSSADPDEVSAQIDLIGVRGLMSGVEPSAAQIGGSRAASDVTFRCLRRSAWPE